MPQRSGRGLDWFVFFVADVQTGFGPFIAVYLTSQKWTQVDIGFILTVGGLISLFGQIPGGALLDRMQSPRRAAAIAVSLICLSALILALWPTYPGVLLSRILQAGASCVLGPAIAALSLGLVPRHRIGDRFGRNAAFASVGTGLAAAVMGFVGYYVSNQAVFFVTALLGVPALLALFQIKREHIDVTRSHGGVAAKLSSFADAIKIATSHRIIFIFAGCVFLFHLANAAVLPLIASGFTLRSSSIATPLTAAAMVIPQFIVALTSPVVGRLTSSIGRRPLLLTGFGALVIRIMLTAQITDPAMIVAVQIFDGIAAAVLGVLVPVTVADITRNMGHFNLVQGIVACAMGIGAAISTTMAGYLADRFSTYTAFLALDVIALVGLLAIWVGMPETRPDDDQS
ncbi:MFS transporter [Bradyrhizobium sp. LHD-71]|uniref:MFS transporter n=1 Tax=Bradyrhizobium sp. LHD-71 TaxID=3072141 RepID=UPI00280F21B1|nr:MFS transporter [Bradyrhizobium sp. LHD-71]MDQ8729747.1 MFS transporter [Bradyrhizobium sp. LHD-71]